MIQFGGFIMWRHLLRYLPISAMVLGGSISTLAKAQGTSWPTVPLFIGLNVPPALVLSVDDSGSMDSEVLLPTNDGALWWHTGDKSFAGRDESDNAKAGALNYNAAGNANSTWKKYTYLFPNGTGTGNRLYSDATNDHFAAPPLPQFAFLRSPTYNGQYYDPLQTYKLWPSSYGQVFADANPQSASSDPTRGGNALNLTANLNVTTDNWKFRVQNGMRYNDGGVLQTYTSEASLAFSYYPATYYLPTSPVPSSPYNGSQSNCSEPKPADYKAFESNPIMTLPTGVDAIGPDGRCLTRYEIKPGNTFPSGRTYADEIQNFANWFTYYRKRHSATRGAILRAFDSVRGFRLSTFRFNNRSTLSFYDYPGTSASGTPPGKSTLFNAIKDYVNAGGTPTRESLNHIGVQLARTTDSPLLHSCQRNYGIIFTDGFANNSTITGIGNADGTKGPPYADTYSGTLADIAMQYYDELRSGGNVPKQNGCGLPGAPAWLDCNTAWHLNTYAVTLGAKGTIFGVTHFNREDVYANPPSWPQPNIQRNPRMVDDLFHATINGRGEMLNANNAQELETALVRIINTILDLNASGGGVSVTAQRIATDTRAFYATFDSGDWSGDLTAYPLTLDGVGADPVWRASQAIPAPSARNIVTRSGGSAVAFAWGALSASDKDSLGSEDVLNYVRGDRSDEARNGGTLRNRPLNNVLGDIIHSTPRYLRENDTVFVGANDGMLHAFDGKTGIEKFAYIPSSILPRIKALTESNYQHQYFVDGEIAISSRLDTAGKNILVAALGRGGKGLFALDVTDPGSFGPSNVLWEQAGDTDMGYILGQPIIAKMNNNEWAVIVGNGFDSNSGTAAIYIYRLSDGTLLKKFDTGVGGSNGIATPSVWDDNADGTIDYIYAGDLKGNVWRIDVSSSNTSQWKFRDRQGSSPKPFFTAKSGSNVLQPITAPVGIAYNNTGSVGYGKRFLLFGTGSYFRSGDASDKSQQTWYGLIDSDDDNDVISGRAELASRSVDQQAFFDGKPVRTFSDLVPGDMINKKGWYLDFPGNAGERIVTLTRVVRSGPVNFAYASSIIPSENPCEAGGRGYLNFIDPFTGTRLTTGIIDINDNKDFSDDKLGDTFIGSVDLNIGMPAQASPTTSRIVAPGTTGIDSLRIRNSTQATTGRISWREIIRVK